MSNFEIATRKKLRFNSGRGPLSVEDLWDLKLPQLDAIAVSVDEEIANSPKKSFITTRTVANKEAEIKLEILKHIIQVKLEEEDEKLKLIEKREKKAKIMELLEQKQVESITSKSEDELKQLLAELG
jgi:hypothetical protein